MPITSSPLDASATVLVAVAAVSEASAMLPRARALALALACSLPTACVDGPTLGTIDDEVIGGTVTPDGAYPGVGALLYDLGGGRAQAGCTGTLITPTVVLTAAHCIDPRLGGDALVGFTLAHDTVAAAPTMTAVSRKVGHPQFDLDADLGPGLSQWFDIGVVFLAAPITEVAPIKLPRPVDRVGLVAGADVAIVGYGRTSNDSDESGVKFDAITKLVSLVDAELQIGGGQDQPQNCHGDSGGPGLTELAGQRVVGVVSRSFDLTSDCLSGGAHTRVDAYLDWIFAQDVVDAPCGSGLAPACPAEEDDDDEGGCCSTSSGPPTGPAALSALVVGALLARRRRRP